MTDHPTSPLAGAYRRPLSIGQARECENAVHPACVCRCAGAAHGRNRIAAGGDRPAYEALPSADPHHLPTRAEARAAEKTRRSVRKAHQYHGGPPLPAGIVYIYTPASPGVRATNSPIPCPLCIAEGRMPHPAGAGA